MNYKQLRNEVQLLRDELAIMKRMYEDILYNLDNENFSSRIVKEKGEMKTAIEVNAEGIKTEVTNRENADKQLSSTIQQTAESITTSVSRKMTVKFIMKVMPTSDNTSFEQKGMLCEYKGDLYYYNDISEEWTPYDEDEGVRSQFIQTADGFEFTNDVKIDADLIVYGTIDADRIATDIAYVADNLYIGDYDDDESTKSIYFHDQANISTADDGIGGNTGLTIDASVLYLLKPDRIFVINPNNTSNYITLENYITRCINERLV